jgi:eukaryotic-like serine/threonine-protein kinase
MGVPEARVTESIGRYEVLGRLAMGGMAEILLARLLGPSGFERPLVLKRILPHLAEQQSFVQMFMDEARLAAQIHQRNVVQVHELGRDAKNLYLVMEYLEGENVAGLIRRTIVANRELSPVISAYIIAEACAGLHAAHELTDAAGRPLQLVHRDVSPQNIFVTYSGGVKVLDFGIAKAADRASHTEVGELRGKFDYMSPEQCRGRPLDRRSDIFALGIVLYEMITRKRLFKRESRAATLDAVRCDPILAPSRLVPCPPAVERVVMKALHRPPEHRHQTAAEMRRELMQAVHGLHPDAIPEESVAALLSEIFQDRIEAKRELLRRVRSGAAVGEVPSAEVDSAVEIPELDQPTGSKLRARSEVGGYAMAENGSGTDAEGIALARRRRRVLTTIALVMAVLVLLSGSLLFLLESAPAASRLETVGRTVPRHEIVHVPAPAPASEPEHQKIVISVSSVPDRASVLVADQLQGTTPLELELPKGPRPLELKIRKQGFRDASERVVPDVNQRLRVMLVAERAARGGGKKSGSAPAGGFRRFD